MKKKLGHSFDAKMYDLFISGIFRTFGARKPYGIHGTTNIFQKLEVLEPVCNGFGSINIGRGRALAGKFFSNFFFDLEKINHFSDLKLFLGYSFDVKFHDISIYEVSRAIPALLRVEYRRTKKVTNFAEILPT